MTYQQPEGIPPRAESVLQGVEHVTPELIQAIEGTHSALTTSNEIAYVSPVEAAVQAAQLASNYKPVDVRADNPSSDV